MSATPENRRGPVQPEVDSAGVRRAPCSGRRLDAETCVCGHLGTEHDKNLICRTCHMVCGYCGQFFDQHTDSEWRSCAADLAAEGIAYAAHLDGAGGASDA